MAANQNKQGTQDESSASTALEALTKLKSPTTKDVDLSLLPAQDLQQMSTLVNKFEPTQKKLNRFINFLFMIAGFLWIPIFFSKSFAIPEATFEIFRLNQVRLYVVLMSLWGYNKLRRFSQASMLLQVSATEQKPWYKLTHEDLKRAGKVHVLEWLVKHEESEPKYFHLVLMWLFLGLSILQLSRQILLLLR